MSDANSPRAQARDAMLRQQWGEAIGLWQQHLQSQPQDASAALALSTCLRHLQLLDEAVVMARNALAAAEAQPPANGGEDLRPQVRLQLAHLHAAQQRSDEAGAAYSALLGQPGVGLPAAIGLAQVWLAEGYPSRALAVLAPLSHLASQEPELAQALALAHYEAGDAGAAVAALMPAPGLLPSPAALSNALMFASYVPELRAVEEALGPRVAQVLATTPSALPAGLALPDSGTPGRLRVGWVSADLHAHPVGYFLAAFLPHLREEGVDSVLFSNGHKHDAWAERLAQAAERVVAITGLSTDAACAAVAQEGVDLLVDLSGHTQGHRLDVFARRACPVQAAYLGYFASTFVPAMDWLITDRVHLPPEEADRYSERVAYLPGSRFCWAPPPDAPAPGEVPCARNGYLTFGAFTNLAKISDACVAQWARVLTALPGSRLQLRWKSLVDAQVRQALRQRFAAHGIAPGRIELHGSMRHADMMAAYQEVDVVLDTFPFSGATTSCEALWMGVPVITRSSDRAAGRQTASLLESLGRTDWIGASEDAFVARATACARDTQSLAQARSSLRQEMAASPLTDGRQFAGNFARLLRELASKPA